MWRKQAKSALERKTHLNIELHKDKISTGFAADPGTCTFAGREESRGNL
jgi:hypothetical protein